MGDIITSPRSAAPSTRTATCPHRDCEQGGNDNQYRWAFLYWFVVIAFGYLTICMGWVWHVGLARERKLDKYRVEGKA